MNALFKFLFLVAFGVIGGFLVSLAGGVIDQLLHPECNFCRLAGLSLFMTFSIVFGTLAFIWPTSSSRDSLPRR